MSQYTKLISLDEILRHPERLVGQPASEIAETKIACAAVSAALAACPPTTANPAPEPERWLTPAEAEALFPVKRRWLFNNRKSMPFIRDVSRKVIFISESGLRRWLATRRK